MEFKNTYKQALEDAVRHERITKKKAAIISKGSFYSLCSLQHVKKIKDISSYKTTDGKEFQIKRRKRTKKEE